MGSIYTWQIKCTTIYIFTVKLFYEFFIPYAHLTIFSLPSFLITISPKAVDPIAKVKVTQNEQIVSMQNVVTMVAALAYSQSTTAEVLHGNRKRK
jgi:hypothetical protein